jgi:hypothetical protein
MGSEASEEGGATPETVTFLREELIVDVNVDSSVAVAI